MIEPSFPAVPVIDLHCDLLSYLVRVQGATIHDGAEIGAALPHLKAGHVEVQTLAIFTPTESGSSKWGSKQVDCFVRLGHEPAFHPIRKISELRQSMADHKIGIVAAVENASGFCEEDEPLSFGLEQLEEWINRVGRILYISLTHHYENRFGGGNFSDNVGLKDDGQALLHYLDGRQICVDLAHASDQLAHDILDYTTRYSLDVPIIASHSNFRRIWGHVRNLPDEIAQEILQRGGLIGLNFLRNYIDEERPERFYEHFHHGWNILGAREQLAFGADFFYLKDIPDPKRHPLFHPDFADASRYPYVLAQLAQEGLTREEVDRFAHGNVVNFLQRVWQ
jgi:membrane dipeptidase